MTGNRMTLVHAPEPPGGQPMPGGPQPGAGTTFASVLDTSVVSVEVGGSIDSVRQELDDAFADMKEFHNREPDEVMRVAGGHSARLAELRGRIQRVEDRLRQWKPVRTREIEPALEELRNQFEIASRRHAVREFDWKMETGQR